MNQKILLISCPNITIFQPKLYQEISWGMALIGGALEHHGIAVDSFDFNAALAKMRGEDLLSTYEEDVLTNVDVLLAELQNPKEMPLINRWLNFFMTSIKNIEQYDLAAISVDKVGYEVFMSRGTLHFSQLIAREIRKRKNIKVVGGGKQIVKDLGLPYLDLFFRTLGDWGMETFFTGNAHECFPNEIKKYFKGEGRIFEKQKFISENSSFRYSNVVPKYDVVNRQDLFVGWKELFPEEMALSEPRILNQDPITIVPYRHSWGCPYKCSFCSSGEDRTLRVHDVEDIVNTLSVLKSKGFENYRWYNDNINLGPKFPVHLANKIIEANIDIYFSDSANMIHTSEPVMQKLKEAGCVKLWFGCETLSTKLLLQNNKQATIEDFYRTIETTKKLGIWTGLYLIIAFPHETLEEYMLTYNFVKERPDLYDSLEVNVFRLIMGTSYALYPEKFNIRLRGASNNKVLSGYDEIGGMTWEERVPEVKNRLKHLRELYSFNRLQFFQNDFILYYLLRSGFSKPEAKVFMEKMYQYLVDNNMISEYVAKIDRACEPHRKVSLGRSINGQGMSFPLQEGIHPDA
jgi:radical SAM superfamily enzyme YgiQ (UPF0313 family)